MSIEGQFVFLLIAFVCFLVDVILDATATPHSRLNLIAGGLASWTFVSLYTAMKAL